MTAAGTAKSSDAVRNGGRLRVLHVFRYFRPDFTGEGLYFEKIEPLLAKRGISNDVLVLAPAGGQSFREETPSHHDHPAQYIARSASSVAASAKLLWWAMRRSRQYRIAHFHSHGDRYFLGKIMMRLLGLRIVQSCTLDDSPTELLESYKRLYRPFVALLLSVIDIFIVISPRLLESALASTPRDRVRFIPQGVALPPPVEESRDEIRRNLGFASDDIMLLFVGGIIERKDPLFLIEMLPRLRASMPHIKLVLVGPNLDDEYERRVTSRIAELGLADCVRQVGYLENPAPYYRGCDIFVFASHQEGFGNVVIEAMAYSLPVVSRLLRGVTDYIIASGRTGFLFTGSDEYCAHIERLVADRRLRGAVGEAARAHVAENFDLADIAAQYSHTYAYLARL
jgi:teichuronic acid biosynthesis glycosyltransferase TuaC